MKRLLVGATLAALAMFLWGFLYWAVLPFPWMVLERAPDEAGLTAAIRELPGTGVYVLPHPHAGTPEEVAARTEAGPVAQLVVRMEGRSATDPSIFLGGFAHMWVSALLMGLLLRRADARSYGSAFALALVAGLAAAVWSNLGRPVWFAQPWGYHLLNAVYDLTGWIVAGAVLARFAREA